MIPNMLIAAAGQTTNLNGVEIFNTLAGPDVVTAPNIDSKTGKVNYLSGEQKRFFSGGNIVSCDKLQAHTSFEVSFAIVVLSNLNGASPGVIDSRTLFELTFPNGAPPNTYLNGESPSMFGPRTSPTNVHIEGTYDGPAKRPHSFKGDYSVTHD